MKERLLRKCMTVLRTLGTRRRARGAVAQAGMTLVEIMIVVAIIGMIVTTVSVAAYNQLSKSRITTARGQIHQLNQAVTLYRAQHNDDCPKTLDDLVADKLMAKVPLDPWGQPYLYHCPRENDESNWDIVSKGPDKKENTNDDIRSDN